MAQKLRRSRVFIVRLWTEDLGDQLVELRGLVRDPQSGEAHYFRCWQELVAFFVSQAGVQESKNCQP